MGGAMTLGLLAGGLSALTSYANDQQQARQYSAQADAARAQAKQAQMKGELEAQEIERRKTELRRQYQETQSHNRSMLAAGNVDMTSGSAAQVSEGNINRFAIDVGENVYGKALKNWETKYNVGVLNNQADNLESMASAKSAFVPSILNAAISGAGSFASAYSLAGGSIRNWFTESPGKTMAGAKAAGAGVKVIKP